MKRMMQFLLLAVAGLVSSGFPALTESYPTRPIRLIVGFAAGGGTDLIGRTLAEQLSAKMKANVIVENMPGAGTTIAAGAVARAAPDGYTVLLATSSVPINQSLMQKLNYDVRTDFTAVGEVGKSPFCMIVRADSPFKSFRDFLSVAQSDSKKLNFGSGGKGSVGHLSIELLMSRSKFKAVHVPYRGNAPAIAGLLSGDVDFVFADLASALSHVRAGTVRALAVTTNQRISWLPDVPTIAESGIPGYEVVLKNYLLVPAQVPAENVTRLRKGLNKVFQTPDRDLTERYERLGVVFPPINTQPMPATFLTSEVDLWNKVITGANISAN